jgi:hypothetical protein
VLRRDGIDEDPLDSNSEPFESWRNILQLRRYRAKIPPIEIRVAMKRNEFRSAVFNSVAERAAGQESDLVAFGEQKTRDRKQRINMARRGRRSDKNFHHMGPQIADEARLLGLPIDAAPSGAKVRPALSHANGQHGVRAPLRKNFRDSILRYVCNGAAASKRSAKHSLDRPATCRVASARDWGGERS